jgi:hypothetical protein
VWSSQVNPTTNNNNRTYKEERATHVETRLRAHLLLEQQIRDAQLGHAIDLLLVGEALLEAYVTVDGLLHAQAQRVVLLLEEDAWDLLVRLAALGHEPGHDLGIALEEPDG